MLPRIKRISIHAFRGIPDLELELDRKSLLLLGENGTGKSSIVEAIEFFFTGKVSSLEGVQGLSLGRHAPHVNFKPSDVRVDLAFDPGNVTLRRTFDSEPLQPEQLHDYFQVTQKGTFILRRSQMVAFIVSRPADRFTAIGSIIGVETLDSLELEMMRLRDELKGKVESKEQERQNLLQDLSGILGEEVTRFEDILPAFNRRLEEAGLPRLGSLDDVDAFYGQILKRGDRSSERATSLLETVELTREASISGEFLSELRRFNERVVALLKHKVKDELSVAELVRNGRELILQGLMDACPLCQQPIDRDSLIAGIDRRLELVRALSEKASEMRTDAIPILEALESKTEVFKRILSKVGQFEHLAEERTRLEEARGFLDTLKASIEAAKELRSEIAPHEAVQWRDRTDQLLTTISKKCATLMETTGFTEKERQVLSVLRFVEQVKQKTNAVRDVTSELAVIKDEEGLAELIYSQFSSAKKQKIQEVYSAIQGDVQRFYAMIHPDEPHKNIKLAVAARKRASTELKVESFGRSGEDPRALSSEGHIDSLGLCIFLAFVSTFNRDCSLIMLDDVVTTVDAGHRERVCKLLMEEFGKSQLVITTHDGVWYEQLRASQRAHGLDGNFMNMTIVGWTVDTGPTVRPYKPRWERIKDRIAQGDKLGAGNEGRQYLEWILEEICDRHQASLVFKKERRYVVEEMFPVARQRLVNLLPDGELKDRVARAFQDLESTKGMGNLLSHSNVLATEISVSEVQSFCEAVHSLVGAVSCPNCQDLLTYDRDLRIICCPNSRCQDRFHLTSR